MMCGKENKQKSKKRKRYQSHTGISNHKSAFDTPVISLKVHKWSVLSKNVKYQTTVHPSSSIDTAIRIRQTVWQSLNAP
eukprot:scaffold5357_cov150-Skeletonema_menzelii.AAC.2